MPTNPLILALLTPRLNIPFTLGAALLLGTIVATLGCGGSGPKMSGFALGGIRIVSSGDEVTLRSPLTADGERRWKVVSYDSIHLGMIEAPRVVRNQGGTGEIMTRAIAKAPGVTEVVIAEIRPDKGHEPRTVTFRVRITN